MIIRLLLLAAALALSGCGPGPVAQGGTAPEPGRRTTRSDIDTKDFYADGWYKATVFTVDHDGHAFIVFIASHGVYAVHHPDGPVCRSAYR